MQSESIQASATTSSIELSQLGDSPAAGHHEDENQALARDDEREIGALAEADGGKAAWGYLAASVVIETLVWGFVFSFGVFQSFYESHEFPGQGSFAAVGTSSSGLLYMSPPLVFPALLAWPQTRRWFPIVGLVVMCAGLVGASFAQSKDALIVTQGIIYSAGGSLVYSPAIFFMDEWFVRRKGMAFGVMWAGTGLGGILLPLIFNAGLSAFGFRTVLRAYAVIMACLMGPILPFLRARLPPSPTYNLSLKFLLSPSFLILQAGNTVQAFGYFLPSIYLPMFASMLGASDTLATLTVVLVNAAAVFGSILMGLLVDRYEVTTCILVSAIGTAVGIFLIWGMSHSLAPLYVFCIFYGLFAGSYSVCWTGIMRLLSRKIAQSNPLMIFSFLAIGRGIGNIVSGPLSSVLLSGKSGDSDTTSAYRSEWMPMILFVGFTSILGGFPILGRIKHGLVN